MTITNAIAAVGLISGILSLGLSWRRRSAPCAGAAALKGELERARRECLEQVAHVAGKLEEMERNAGSVPEFPAEGRLGISARARALRMLRSGTAPETAAIELGLPVAEVRLLEKVGNLLVFAE